MGGPKLEFALVFLVSLGCLTAVALPTKGVDGPAPGDQVASPDERHGV